MASWFFLSYARRDEGDRHYVSSFFKRLAGEVAPKAAIPPEEAGFLDQSMTPGQRWEPEIAEALRTCRTLVCLLSPSYLVSEYCGKELRIFFERLEKHGAPPLLLPILWDRPDDVRHRLPPVLQKLYFSYQKFGTKYEEKGLSYLVKTRGYTRFTLELADHLVTIAQNHCLPAGDRVRKLSQIQSVFRRDASYPRTKRQALRPNKSRASGVVSPRELHSSGERLDEEVFAIELLKRPITLGRDTTGQVKVTIDRNGVKEMLISNQAKMIKTKQYVTPEKVPTLLSLDRKIHTLLAEGALNNEPVPIDLSKHDLCLRWASGGILSIVTINGKQWVPLFFRDIRPYGWNTALGTTERWFTKRSGYRLLDRYYSLESDLTNPLDFILREFLEEVLIVRGIPRKGGILYYKRFQFPQGVSAISKARAEQFYESHCRLRSREDGLEIRSLKGRATKVVFRNPRCSLEIQHSNSRPVQIPGVLICFSLLDLGIEVVRVAEYELEEGDWILDGEIRETYSAATKRTHKVLVRMPTALLSLDYLREIFGSGQGWQVYTFGPQPSIKVARGPDPNADEIRFFDWDIKRRMQAIEGEWDAKSMASRYLDWYDKFGENFIGNRERPGDKWQLTRTNASQFFVPGTAKALNLYFRLLGRGEIK